MGDWNTDTFMKLLEASERREERLLDLLEKAISGSTPEAVIRALNPPYAPAPDSTSSDPFAGMEGPPGAVSDAWGDEALPDHEVIPGFGGWTEPTPLPPTPTTTNSTSDA